MGWLWTILLLAHSALYVDAALKGVNSTDCFISASGPATACPLRGAQLLTITGDSSANFGTNASATSVVLTRPAGVPQNPNYEEARCVTSPCQNCIAATTTMQCWLVVPYGQNTSGVWTLQANDGSGNSQGTLQVTLGKAIPPVISGTDGCPDYNGRRALNCINGHLITIEGSNFDNELSDQNVVVFARSTYAGAISGNTYPICYNVNSLTQNRIFCNLTYPPGSRGEFAIQVTTQGTPSTYYPYAESTVSVANITLTPTMTLTGTATHSASLTSTGSSTVSASPTRTSTRSPSATITRSTSITATATPTATETGTTTRSASPTASGTLTESATATATRTASRTGSGTLTPSRTATRTATPTSTGTASPTASGTLTGTNTDTSTGSASLTSTASETRSASLTTTRSGTDTATTSLSRSATLTSTTTSSLTVIPTHTLSPTSTSTPTATRTATASYTTTMTQSETTIPHFSGEAMITFNFHVDYWTDDQRLAFQQVVAAFFDQYLGWNAVPAPRAGVANIEVVKIRMAEDSLGHRVPPLSVVHWHIINIGYGYLQKSAEDLMTQALNSPSVNYLYWMLRNAFLDAVDGTFMRPPVPNAPQCALCNNNPAYARPYDIRFPPAPYKCTYTYNSETSVVQADALSPPYCDPANNNYKVGPVGSNIFAS
eukprot:EG_transcript_4921